MIELKMLTKSERENLKKIADYFLKKNLRLKKL